MRIIFECQIYRFVYKYDDTYYNHYSHSRATVLYDRPPKIFYPISIQEKHNWFFKISQEYPEFGCHDAEVMNNKTAFTQVMNGVVESRGDRPGLLFSSTSWTEDEDFKILMEALQGENFSRERS